MVPNAKTSEEPVKILQSPMASINVKLSLQIVPHLPAKNISTRPAVRDSDIPSFLDTNLTVDEAVMD